jgi:hypothetical protein
VGGSLLTPEQTAQIEAEYILPTNEPAVASPHLPQPAPGQPQPAPRVAVAQQPIQQRLSGAIHAQLTVHLRQFIEKNGRMPETFGEFSNSAMDSIPLAPDGMKFVIDTADRTVKAVKK